MSMGARMDSLLVISVGVVEDLGFIERGLNGLHLERLIYGRCCIVDEMNEKFL